MITCHLHLADQVHILLLVLLRDQDVGSIGFQVPHFTHAKLLDLYTNTHQKRTLRSHTGLVFFHEEYFPFYPLAAKTKKRQITNLSAERQLIAQRGDIVLQQVHQALEEGVVLAFHIRVPEDHAGENASQLSNIILMPISPATAISVIEADKLN